MALIEDESEVRPIKAGSSPNGERACIVITDHGAGIDQKAQSRLFEPFFTTKKRGTGLGLSIVRQIIDLHGGNIDVKSTAARRNDVSN